jgi:hypothetical protein
MTQSLWGEGGGEGKISKSINLRKEEEKWSREL